MNFNGGRFRGNARIRIYSIRSHDTNVLNIPSEQQKKLRPGCVTQARAQLIMSQ